MRKSTDIQSKDLPDLDYGILHGLVGHLLRHAFNIGQNAFKEVFGDEKITPLQFMILELVSRNPNVSHTEICKAMRASPSVVTTTLKPLLATKLIERQRKEKDSRQSTYRISPTGMTIFADLRPRIQFAEERILERLSVEDRDLLVRALQVTAQIQTADQQNIDGGEDPLKGPSRPMGSSDQPIETATDASPCRRRALSE